MMHGKSKHNTQSSERFHQGIVETSLYNTWCASCDKLFPLLLLLLGGHQLRLAASNSTLILFVLSSVVSLGESMMESKA